MNLQSTLIEHFNGCAVYQNQDSEFIAVCENKAIFSDSLTGIRQKICDIKNIRYYEYVGNVYELMEERENKVVLMHTANGDTVELSRKYFETLRELKIKDISFGY